MPKLEQGFDFDIDNGELYGLTDAEIFVLGFELGQIYTHIESANLLDILLIHRSNRERVEKLLRQHNYKYDFDSDFDKVDGWIKFDNVRRKEG